MSNINPRLQNKKNINTLKKVPFEKKSNLPLMLLIAFCFPFLLYLQTINFGFTGFDDDGIISDNIAFLSKPSNAPQAFLTNAFISKVSKFYRPMGTLSYMLDISISGGDNPWMYHLSNILLFGFITCMLFLFLRQFLIPPKPALIGSLIYSVHPLFVFYVTWIPAREDLLLTFFSLLSFLFFIKHLNNGKNIYLFIHWIAFSFALFCKETAAFLPFLFIIYFFSMHRNRHFDKKYLLNILLYGISGLLWFWLRSKAITSYAVQDKEFGFTAFFSNLRTIPESLAKFFLPVDISPIPSFTILKTMLGLCIIIFISIMVFRRLKILNREIIFCFSWFLILMLPSMSYKNPYIDYLDHRFYLPLIGILLFLLIVYSKKMPFSGSYKISFFIGIIFIFFCSFAFFKSRSYINKDEFYNSVITYNPNSSMAYNNLGTEKYKRNDFKGALDYYNNAIEIMPGYFEAYNNRGLIYNYLNQYDNAIESYTRAIELRKDYSEAYNNRGIVYYNLKEYDRAIQDYNKSIELKPDFPNVYYNRGNVFNVFRQYDKTMADYNKAIELNPKFFDAYNNRGWLYFINNKVDEGISDLKTAVSLNQSYFLAYKNLAWAYYSLKNYNESINNYSIAISLSGTDGPSFYFRGMSYYYLDRIDLACMDWFKARQSGMNEPDQYIEKYCK
jgi:tetratricopeptide (TPR) repeat protein